MSEQRNHEAVQRVCLGNQEAVHFLEDITEVLHLWDDLIDRDQVLTDASINKTMWKALVALPRNSFYAQNFLALNTVLVAAIVNWEIATGMERDPAATSNDEVIAFIIRSSYIDLVTLVAVLCGGPEHAVTIMREARQLWHDEGLVGYRQSLVLERSRREGA